ncbi:MAG TPA: hypothetical protein VKP69_31325, partial [Isosphaeraceae bacterium]|nr:hypothetical protein [Isosphaeraceae bacterium]
MDDRYTGQSCLVGQEGKELMERPTRELIASVATPGRNPFADALQVFQGNPASGAFGGLDDRFRDAMVFVPAEPGLFPGDSLQLFLRPFGVPPLESFPLEIVFAPDLLNVSPGMLFAIRIGCDVENPQVHAEEVLDL